MEGRQHLTPQLLWAKIQGRDRWEGTREAGGNGKKSDTDMYFAMDTFFVTMKDNSVALQRQHATFKPCCGLLRCFLESWGLSERFGLI